MGYFYLLRFKNYKTEFERENVRARERKETHTKKERRDMKREEGEVERGGKEEMEKEVVRREETRSREARTLRARTLGICFDQKGSLRMQGGGRRGGQPPLGMLARSEFHELGPSFPRGPAEPRLAYHSRIFKRRLRKAFFPMILSLNYLFWADPKGATSLLPSDQVFF